MTETATVPGNGLHPALGPGQLAGSAVRGHKPGPRRSRVVRIKFVIPFPLAGEALQARADQIPPGLLRPEVEVSFATVRNWCGKLESQYERLLLALDKSRFTWRRCSASASR